MYIDKEYDKNAEGYFDPSIEVEVTLERNGRLHETVYSCPCDDCTPEAIEEALNQAKRELVARCEDYLRVTQCPAGCYRMDVTYSLHDPYGDDYLDSDRDEDFFWNGERLGIIGLKL